MFNKDNNNKIQQTQLPFHSTKHVRFDTNQALLTSSSNSYSSTRSQKRTQKTRNDSDYQLVLAIPKIDIATESANVIAETEVTNVTVTSESDRTTKQINAVSLVQQQSLSHTVSAVIHTTPLIKPRITSYKYE